MRQFVRFMRSMGLRGRRGVNNTRLAWRWFLRQVLHVQIAFVVDLVITFIAIYLTVTNETNWWARYAMIPSFLISLYIARKAAAPVWVAEVGAELADRAVTKTNSWWDTFRGNIPWWASWVVGKPGEAAKEPAAKPHLNDGHAVHPDAVWHDTSVGGHIFHIIGTIGMWKNVLLLTCSVFPVWERDWMSAVTFLTVIILYFVWTEDFVDIKKWRARLGYAVTIIALFYMGPMALRTIAPGTYNYWMAKFGYNQEINEVAADGVNEDAVAHKALYRRLQSDKRAYEDRYHIHLDHAPDGRFDADWTPGHSTALKSITDRMESIKAANPEDEDDSSLLTFLHPIYMGAMGIGLVFLGLLVSPFMKGRS